MGSGASAGNSKFEDVNKQGEGITAQEIAAAFNAKGTCFPLPRAEFIVKKFGGEAKNGISKENYEKALAYVCDALDSEYAEELAAAWRAVPPAKVPNSDVVKLIEEFKETGLVPLSLTVSEVEAIQQAGTKQLSSIDACEVQVAELRKRLQAKGGLNDYAKNMVNDSMDRLTTRLKAEREQLQHTKSRLEDHRTQSISRYTPSLIGTVDLYDKAFQPFVDQELSALKDIASLCKEAKGKVPNQLHPDETKPKDHAATLLLLMEAAEKGIDALGNLANKAAKFAGDGVVLLAPLKGIPRAMQKAQEDYNGDYTRLVDLVRCSIVFKRVEPLAKVLKWLLHDAAGEKPSFKICRAKDRLSLDWDAELSGGNRDILLNGWLELEDGTEMVVEIQLHLKDLFALKADLHTLYDGSRILNSSDDLVAVHDGALTESALSRAELGVVRKLRTDFTVLEPGMPERVVKLMELNPCPVVELWLSLARWKDGQRNCFNNFTLQDFFPRVHPRLQALSLNHSGITGNLPGELFECRQLSVLFLGGNRLTGVIPETVGQLRKLKEVSLRDNQLEGQIPSSFADLPLTELKLHNNKFTGDVPVSVKKLKERGVDLTL